MIGVFLCMLFFSVTFLASYFTAFGMRPPHASVRVVDVHISYPPPPIVMSFYRRRSSVVKAEE